MQQLEKKERKRKGRDFWSATGIKGRKEGGFRASSFWLLAAAGERKERKENSTNSWVFHGFSWCSCSWTLHLVIGSILFRILSILFKLGVLFLLALILLYG